MKIPIRLKLKQKLVLPAGIAMLLLLFVCVARKDNKTNIVSAKPFPQDPSILRSYHYTVNGATVLVNERREAYGEAILRSKTIEMSEDCVVFAGSVTSKDTTQVRLLEWDTDSVHLHFSDGTEWHERIPQESGSYQAGCIFIDMKDAFFSLYLPQCYEHIENGCIRYLPDYDGRLDITKQSDGSYHLAVIATNEGASTSADFFFAYCKQPIIDWSNESQMSFWKPYINKGEGRFLYSGYYWISSTLNETHGEEVYANNVACYLGKSFVYGAPFYDAMKAMSLFMMDAMIDNQNEEGYWPSNVVSGWLHEDYGIAAPYYDTRFNSDFAEILMRSCRDFGIEEFKEPLRRYFAFYKSFASRDGWEMEGGLAVPDYYYPGMTTPHMALNHQLKEIDVLYEAAELLNDDELAILADSMLKAIETTAPRWIRNDGDLHYCVHPDGSFDGKDYPYLTYNDLFNMQNRLQAMGRPRSEALQLLMNAKKIWMNRNGITGYKQ